MIENQIISAYKSNCHCLFQIFLSWHNCEIQKFRYNTARLSPKLQNDEN